jgi:hypothetical protein
MSSGCTSHGAKAEMASAAGTRIALLSIAPLATAHTTGSSRSGFAPETCSAFSARSSPMTPAVFLVATRVISATSSRMLVMSSSRASRPVPGMAGKLSPSGGGRHGASHGGQEYHYVTEAPPA